MFRLPKIIRNFLKMQETVAVTHQLPNPGRSSSFASGMSCLTFSYETLNSSTMSKKTRIKIKEARFAIDFGDPKETLYYKLFLRRARLMDAKEAIQQIDVKHQASDSLGDTEEDERAKKTQPSTGKRKRTTTSFPTGDNLQALEHVVAHGLDHEELAQLLYGEDTDENRAKVSSRIQFWRKKGWYVKHKDGSYEIVMRFLEEAREAVSEDDEE